MITKGTLYRLAENITPPGLMRGLKKTRFYRFVSNRASVLDIPPPAQKVTIESGDLKDTVLKLYPEGAWQKEMIAGTYDHELFEFLKNFELKGKVIFDVGAHIGYHSLMFAKLTGESGYVHTFEPNPANIARAKEIFSLNPSLQKQINLHEVALSNTVGTTSLFCTPDVEYGTSSGGFIDQSETIWERSVYIDTIRFKEIPVTQETIDHLYSTGKVKGPDIIKIDVEGAEHLVLEGAKETITASRPLIIVEFHSIFAAYASTLVLDSLNYKTQVLKKEPDGRTMIAATPL